MVVVFTYAPIIFYGKISVVKLIIKLLLLMKSARIMCAINWNDIVTRNTVPPSEI
jgi:hypothetical protein